MTSPVRHPARWAALLDAAGDSDVDGVVRVAAALTGLSCATVNLFDGTVQRQLSPHGFTGGTSPLEHSLCADLLAAGATVAVADDLSLLARFAHNPWVDGRLARVRAYGSAALVADGRVIGSLCVFDERPHAFSAAEADRLTDLAAVLVALLERCRQADELAELATASELARQEVEAAHAELAASTAFTTALLEALPVGIVAADARGRINLFNRVSRAWHGLDADPSVPVDDVPGTFRLVSPTGRPLDVSEIPLFRVLAEGRIANVPIAIADPDDRLRLVEVSGEPIHAADGTLLGAVVAMDDVTERRALEEELRMAALHDPLTGLPNRTLLVDRLAALVVAAGRSGEPFAVLYCDLDGFKPVNDVAGHATGDIVLRKAARRLRAAVRPGDTVGRIGGDEFVLLCPGLRDELAARDVADRVTASFAEPLALANGTRHEVGISVGAVLCDATDTPLTALARADAAMYRVKAARRAAPAAR
ncbi:MULTISPECIES: diguanylate cyclase domain-containing protein [unclassified Blastococcus]